MQPNTKSSLKRNLAALAAASLLLFPSLGNLRAQSIEQYAITGTGVSLRWAAYAPQGGGTHPAILVLHAGGFKIGIRRPAKRRPGSRPLRISGVGHRISPGPAP